MTVDMRLRHISGACATFNLEIAFWSLDRVAVVAAPRNLPQALARSVECVAHSHRCEKRRSETPAATAHLCNELIGAAMDIHQLELFLAVMDSPSMTRAAEKIHLSPGAVSLQLHNLADELHTELFVRRGKRLIPP